MHGLWSTPLGMQNAVHMPIMNAYVNNAESVTVAPPGPAAGGKNAPPAAAVEDIEFMPEQINQPGDTGAKMNGFTMQN